MLVHLTTFELFESKSKPVVTFDFDGLFHVGKHFELDSAKRVRGTPEEWEFSKKMRDLFNKESKHNRCFVVSRRPVSDTDDVKRFLEMHGVKPEKVFCVPTHAEKAAKIKELKSTRHYDDQERVLDDLEELGYDIEYYLVDDKQDFKKAA